MTDDPHEPDRPGERPGPYPPGPGMPPPGWPGWGEPPQHDAPTAPIDLPPAWAPPGPPPPLGPGYGHPYGQGGGWGAPPGPPQTEGLAIAALLLALASFLLPVVLAIAALLLAASAAARIRASGGALQGEGMVTAARVLSTLNLVAAALGAILVVALLSSHGTTAQRGRAAGPVAPAPSTAAPPPTEAPATSAPESETVAFDDLVVGDCFQEPPDNQEGASDVRVLDCRKPHDLEVFAIVRAPGGAKWPGDRALERAGDRLCTPRFRSYVGTPVADSRLDFIVFFPEKDAWEQGGPQERTLLCALGYGDGRKLTGSMRGSHR